MKLVCTKLDLKGIRTYFTRRQILMKLYSWKWIPNDGAPPFHIAPTCQQFSEECNGSQNKICKCWKFRKLHHYFVHSSFLQCIRGFSISVKKCLCNFGKLLWFELRKLQFARFYTFAISSWKREIEIGLFECLYHLSPFLQIPLKALENNIQTTSLKMITCSIPASKESGRNLWSINCSITDNVFISITVYRPTAQQMLWCTKPLCVTFSKWFVC